MSKAEGLQDQKLSSIGLKSGEYSGMKISLHPGPEDKCLSGLTEQYRLTFGLHSCLQKLALMDSTVVHDENTVLVRERIHAWELERYASTYIGSLVIMLDTTSCRMKSMNSSPDTNPSTTHHAIYPSTVRAATVTDKSDQVFLTFG
jgi:hypothetical protein